MSDAMETGPTLTTAVPRPDLEGHPSGSPFLAMIEWVEAMFAEQRAGGPAAVVAESGGESGGDSGA